MILGAILDTWEPVLGFGAALGATCGYVVWVAARVDRWRKQEQARNEAIDTFTADWDSRGLTPQGAMDEAASIRDAVHTHSSAIAGTTRRVNDVEIRVAAVEETAQRQTEALEHLNDRFDDVDSAIGRLAQREGDR